MSAIASLEAHQRAEMLQEALYERDELIAELQRQLAAQRSHPTVRAALEASRPDWSRYLSMLAAEGEVIA